MKSSHQHANALNDPSTGDRPEDPREEIAQLRAQVEQLMRDCVTPAVADAAGRAEEAVLEAKAYARERVETLSRSVRARPLTALAIAAGVGYVLGRVRH
jgi:ElaB/YqjD/DUF883 family membrane-anchored ribosome-binding protein